MISSKFIFRMKKIKYVAFVSILALFTACNSDVFEEHEIGGNLIDQSTDVFMIDTFTVEGSMVKLDSVTTSGFGNVLLGKYNDPYFGNVKSDFFGEVNLASQFTLRESNGETVYVEFDSLVFIMYHEASKLRFVGDTLAEQTISVHRVTEEFELPDNKLSYKAHDKLAYETEALGSTTFIPNLSLNSVIEAIKDEDPLSEKGGIRIRLDDALGLDIIDKVNSSDDDLNEILEDNVKWLNYFKGIVLKADDNNSAIFSFQTGTGMKMRVYYHDKDYNQAGVLRYYDLPITAANPLHFTNHGSDFMSDDYSYIQKINDIENSKDDLSSEETGDLCFLQGGTGLMTKVRIPHIELLNRMGLTGGILKAELVFSPEKNSYDKDLYPLPYSRFELYSTNKKNLFVNSVINPSTNSQLTSTYVYNFSYIDESYYTFDITNYVNNILLNGQEEDNALLITLPMSTIGNSVERLVIDNDRNSDTRIKLEVTYVVQNN
jgi:hypothetical protein